MQGSLGYLFTKICDVDLFNASTCPLRFLHVFLNVLVRKCRPFFERRKSGVRKLEIYLFLSPSKYSPPLTIEILLVSHPLLEGRLASSLRNAVRLIVSIVSILMCRTFKKTNWFVMGNIQDDL